MSLTAEQSKLINRKLKQWLDSDRQIVNFRQVSREIGCHVDIAKNVLLEHARSNPSVQITYLLSGPLLATSSLAQTQLPSDGLQLDAKALAALEASQRVKIRDMDEVSDGERNSDDGTEEDDELVGNDKGGEGGISGKGHEFLLPETDAVMEPEQTPRWGVVMAQQAQFETKRGLFEPSGLNIHIYALSPAPVTDPAQYLTPNTLLRQYPKYNDIKYGGISGDFSAEGSGSGSKSLKDGVMALGSTSASAAKKGEVNGKKAEVGTKKAGEKEEKGKAVPVTKTKKDEVKAEPGTKGAKGKAVKQESKAKEPAKPIVKAKAETSQPTSSASRKPSTQSRSKKRIITSDDESEQGSNAATDAADPPTPSSADVAAKASTSSMVREEDQAAMEAMMDMGMSDEEFEMMDAKPAKVVKKPAARASAAKKGAAEGEAGASKSGRKRRVVKKSKTEIDEKGYMVTRDYTSEESYSGDSDAGPSKAKPRKSAASNSSAMAGGKSKSSQQSQSRASSVSTEINEERESKKGGSSAAMGSSASVASTATKAKPAPPPPKNVPGKAGKPKGQSTLAGFFTKK